jgi:hypothetical protein
MLYDVVIDKKVVDRNVDYDVVFMWVEVFPEAEVIVIMDDGKRYWVSQQKLGL